MRLAFADTSLSLSRTGEYVHISAGKDLTSENGEAVKQRALISLGTSDSTHGGVVMLSENTTPIAYEILTNNGRATDPGMRLTVESALGYFRWAAEQIESMPVGSPIYHN